MSIAASAVKSMRSSLERKSLIACCPFAGNKDNPNHQKNLVISNQPQTGIGV